MANLVTSELLLDVDRRARRLVAATTASLAAPGRRSVLRRSLGRPLDHPSVHRAHGLVAQYLPEFPDGPPDSSAHGDVEAIERAFYTVAALIAAQPRGARDDELARRAAAQLDETSDPAGDDQSAAAPEPGNLATAPTAWYRRDTFGRTLAQAVRTGKVNGETAPARLHLICRQDVAGVHRHLPRLVGHLRSDVVPVDWVRLTVDLARWGRYGDQVAKSWLQDYYRMLAVPKPPQGNASAPSPSGPAGSPESE